MAFKDYSGTPASNTEIGDSIFIGPDMPRNNVRPALQQIAADGKALADIVEPTGERAGKFLAWDASGNAFASAGPGGADNTLRADLASTSGLALAATARGVDADTELRGFSTRAAVKALIGASRSRVYLSEAHRQGTFIYHTNAEFTARFAISGADAATSDTAEGIWLRADDASGVWVRDFPTGGVWQASWFGWKRNSDGGTGATNRAALRAIEALINSNAGGVYPFGPGNSNQNQLVFLGYGIFDLGTAGDSYGLRRTRGNYFGAGVHQTEIRWTGDASGKMIQWENVRRGFFNQCFLTYSGNKPKAYIDMTYDSGLFPGAQHVCDYGDNFDNFYDDVSSDADAAAVVLKNIVNMVFNTVRFQGGTRHIYVYQASTASYQRGLRIQNYTFDFSNGGAGVFKEHICVDITGNGSLAVYLAPTRAEGGAATAVDAAILRVTDTVGPNAIGLYAVTLTIADQTGWQWSTGANSSWVVYHDTTQTTCYTPIHFPNGIMLGGFQGIHGGNWNTGISKYEPTFTAYPGGTQLAPYSNDPRSDNVLGTSARTTGPVYFGSGTAAQVGTITTRNGSPEGQIAAAGGSICLNPASSAGFNTYRKTSSSGNTGWVNISQTKGAISGSTDASGDITVTHGFGGTPSKVNAKIDGTTLYAVQCHTIGGSTFKVRVFNPTTGAAVASTAVTGWWEAETTS